jgi:hypothetical protein
VCAPLAASGKFAFRIDVANPSSGMAAAATPLGSRAAGSEREWARSLRRELSPRYALARVMERERNFVREVIDHTPRIGELEQDVSALYREMDATAQLSHADSSRIRSLEEDMHLLAERSAAVQMTVDAASRRAAEAYEVSQDALAAASVVARVTHEAEVAHGREHLKMVQLSETLANESTTRRLREAELAIERERARTSLSELASAAAARLHDAQLAHERETARLSHDVHALPATLELARQAAYERGQHLEQLRCDLT